MACTPTQDMLELSEKPGTLLLSRGRFGKKTDQCVIQADPSSVCSLKKSDLDSVPTTDPCSSESTSTPDAKETDDDTSGTVFA